MTLDVYTGLIFLAGLLTGVALALLRDAANQHVLIVRYLRRRRAATPGRS